MAAPSSELATSAWVDVLREAPPIKSMIASIKNTSSRKVCPLPGVMKRWTLVPYSSSEAISRSIAVRKIGGGLFMNMSPITASSAWLM